MFNVGPLELMVILVVALLVVGPKRLPEVGRSIGKGLRELRKAQDEVQRTIKLTLDEELTSPAASAPAPARDSTPSEGSTRTDADGESSPAPPKASGGPEIAATLGQGIAELRRVREELQRTFRVDIEDETATGATKPHPRAARPEPLEDETEEPSAPTGDAD